MWWHRTDRNHELCRNSIWKKSNPRILKTGHGNFYCYFFPLCGITPSPPLSVCCVWVELLGGKNTNIWKKLKGHRNNNWSISTLCRDWNEARYQVSWHVCMCSGKWRYPKQSLKAYRCLLWRRTCLSDQNHDDFRGCLVVGADVGNRYWW